jgi:hypothetical protein
MLPSSAPHPTKRTANLLAMATFAIFSSSHRQVEKLVAPSRILAHPHLRRFHEQEAEQGVAQFTDMSQPSSFPAGIFGWNQPHIASDLLVATETVQVADVQPKSQCGESIPDGSSSIEMVYRKQAENWNPNIEKWQNSLVSSRLPRFGKGVSCWPLNIAFRSTHISSSILCTRFSRCWDL